ncbi:hypothetical protein BBJ28_00009276 [Nothophytophthora sp. Chile5]|nr:hypothetical protein BBJ28_00009276 [Nothophytophthora sp. Chile5]
MGGRRSRLLATRWSKFCRSVLSFAASTATLFGFHLLTVVLGIGGSALVMSLLLSNIAFLPMSIAFIMLCIFVELVRLVFPRRAWLVLTLMVVGTLITLQLQLGWDTFLMGMVFFPLVPLAFVLHTILGTLLFYFFIGTVRCLARLDVELANFVDPAIPGVPCTRHPRRKKAMQVAAIDFKDPCERNPAGSLRQFLSLSFMTKNAWAVVFYLVVVKLFVGIMSLIFVFLSVAQPTLAFTSNGTFPCAGFGGTVHEDPAYVPKMVVLGVLGIFGIVYGPALSLQWTLRGCAEYQPEERQQRHVQEEEGREMAHRSDSEDTVASFASLEDAGSAAPLPLEKATV